MNLFAGGIDRNHNRSFSLSRVANFDSIGISSCFFINPPQNLHFIAIRIDPFIRYFFINGERCCFLFIHFDIAVLGPVMLE